MVRKIKESPTYTPFINGMSNRRISLGLSMKHVAEKSKISYGSYGVVESGYSLASKELLDRICKTLKCSPLDVYDKEAIDRISTYEFARKSVALMRINEQKEKENESTTA